MRKKSLHRNYELEEGEGGHTNGGVVHDEGDVVSEKKGEENGWSTAVLRQVSVEEEQSAHL